VIQNITPNPATTSTIIPAQPGWWRAAFNQQPREQVMNRHQIQDQLPYGIWLCADRREVLFNRHYKPIWQRTRVSPQLIWQQKKIYDGPRPQFTDVEIANKDEWVDWDVQGWFYSDDSSPSSFPREVPKIEAVLSDFKAGRSVLGRMTDYRLGRTRNE
jgi:hypothetical protein